MSNLREAAQRALYALESVQRHWDDSGIVRNAIQTLENALAQPDDKAQPGGCSNCGGLGHRLEADGERLPCDLCHERIEHVTSRIEKAIAEHVNGGDKWLCSNLAAKDILEAAAQPSAEQDKAQPLATEFCWLVEHFLGDGTGNSTGDYHTGFTDTSGSSRTTKDPYRAKRYDTWKAANAVSVKLGHTLSGTWKAVQHGFDAASLLFEVERPKGELNQETIHERKLMERVCKCSLRTRLVGDGCEVCNPELAKELAEQGAELSDDERAELDRLRSLINTPHTDEWMSAVELEAAHQQERWGAQHDAGKEPEDWLFLAGYLLGKASASFRSGNPGKGLHHIISASAVALNWHRHATGVNTAMRPGISADRAARGGAA